MKILLLSLLGIITSSQLAFSSTLNGKDLNTAFQTALQEVSEEIDKNSVFAWKTELSQEEILVKVLNEDDFQLSYGCHYHGQHMACHEESINKGDKHYHKDPDVTLDFIRLGHQAALSKFEKTLKRKGQDLSVLNSIKVWSHEDDQQNGHEHGPDVWTKIIYKLDGSDKTIFVLCHVHGQEKDFSCHYNKKGEQEPDLSF